MTTTSISSLPASKCKDLLLEVEERGVRCAGSGDYRGSNTIFLLGTIDMVVSLREEVSEVSKELSSQQTRYTTGVKLQVFVENYTKENTLVCRTILGNTITVDPFISNAVNGLVGFSGEGKDLVGEVFELVGVTEYGGVHIPKQIIKIQQ